MNLEGYWYRNFFTIKFVTESIEPVRWRELCVGKQSSYSNTPNYFRHLNRLACKYYLQFICIELKIFLWEKGLIKTGLNAVKASSGPWESFPIILLSITKCTQKFLLNVRKTCFPPPSKLSSKLCNGIRKHWWNPSTNLLLYSIGRKLLQISQSPISMDWKYKISSPSGKWCSK